MQIEYRKLEDIKPYGRNAKKHKVGWIKKSLEEFKPDQPIVVDGKGVIIKGHGRLKAARELGMTEFPVIVRTDLTSEQVRLARIADNRSAEAGWDFELLDAELQEIFNDIPDFDFEGLGIDDDFLKIDNIETPEKFKEVDEEIETKYECPKCGYRWS